MKQNRSFRKNKLDNEDGMMLITTLCLIAAILTLSAAMLIASVIEVKASERFEHRMIAFHWAKGAIDQTMVNLKSNASYSGVPSTSGSGRVAGTYSSSVTSLGNNAYRISSTGTITGTSTVLDQTRNLQAYVTLSSQSPFAMSLFANQTIAMSGNANTDAYDSRNGAYNAGTATNEGHIGSNQASGNTITLSGNVKIKGNATVGPGAVVNTAITTSGNASITGSKLAASSLTTLSPVTIPSSGVTNLGSISISGNKTQTLAGGIYQVSSISISGNGSLNITGNATIYVTGTVSIAGNGISTASNLPTNLRLNVQGSQVNVSGNGAFYGAIYAPSAQINISGNGAVYGAFVGNTINDSGNGNVHYDKALGSVSGGSSSTSQMTYWTEL